MIQCEQTNNDLVMLYQLIVVQASASVLLLLQHQRVCNARVWFRYTLSLRDTHETHHDAVEPNVCLAQPYAIFCLRACRVRPLLATPPIRDVCERMYIIFVGFEPTRVVACLNNSFNWLALIRRSHLWWTTRMWKYAYLFCACNRWPNTISCLRGGLHKQQTHRYQQRSLFNFCESIMDSRSKRAIGFEVYTTNNAHYVHVSEQKRFSVVWRTRIFWMQNQVCHTRPANNI